jgi:hypothetical protein
MDRRTLIQKFLSVLTLGSVFLLIACKRQEKVKRFGNEGKLWDLASGRRKPAEAVETNYGQKAALFRDASMGKADPSFVPRVSGG